MDPSSLLSEDRFKFMFFPLKTFPLFLLYLSAEPPLDKAIVATLFGLSLLFMLFVCMLLLEKQFEDVPKGDVGRDE